MPFTTRHLSLVTRWLSQRPSLVTRTISYLLFAALCAAPAQDARADNVAEWQARFNGACTYNKEIQMPEDLTVTHGSTTLVRHVDYEILGVDVSEADSPADFRGNNRDPGADKANYITIRGKAPHVGDLKVYFDIDLDIGASDFVDTVDEANNRIISQNAYVWIAVSDTCDCGQSPAVEIKYFKPNNDLVKINAVTTGTGSSTENNYVVARGPDDPGPSTATITGLNDGKYNCVKGSRTVSGIRYLADLGKDDLAESFRANFASLPCPYFKYSGSEPVCPQVTVRLGERGVDYKLTYSEMSEGAPTSGSKSVKVTALSGSQYFRAGTQAILEYEVMDNPPQAVVSGVVARQRWPWNGFVDVDYVVGGYTYGLAARITFEDQDDPNRTWVATNFLAGAEPSAEFGPHRATWNTAGLADIVASNVVATVELLRFPSQIENLQVAGDSGNPVPDRENRFVSEVNVSAVAAPAVTFSLPAQEKDFPVQADVAYKDSGDNSKTRTAVFDAGQTSGSIVLEGGLRPNSEVAITFQYKGLAQSDTAYVFVFDSIPPELSVGTRLASDATVYGGTTYCTNSTPEFQISANGATDWDAVFEEIENPDRGIWLVVADSQTEVFRKKLTSTDVIKINGDDFFVTLPRLSDGSHTLAFWTEDLAGNRTEASRKDLAIDSVKPVVSAEGHNVNYGLDSMYVENPDVYLEIEVKDAHLMFQDTAGCVTMTSNRGASSGPESVVTTVASIKYMYTLDQSYGKNVWSFTVVDAAGNRTVKTFTYDYNKPPQLTNAGVKLQDESLSLTPASPQVENGLLTMGKVADLFKEVDGSSIVADNVSIDNLGDAVVSWGINDEGQVVLTLADFAEGGTATLSSPGITLLYTDEYNKTANIEFDLEWKNE